MHKQWIGVPTVILPDRILCFYSYNVIESKLSSILQLLTAELLYKSWACGTFAVTLLVQ
jgi:hypothetical protein